MGFEFRPLNDADAHAIVGWHYEPPYDFYDLTADPDDLREFLDEERWGTTLFAAYTDEDLVGWVSVEDACEIGLALRPDLTGRSFGEAFVRAAVAFATERSGAQTVILSVAEFNERAIAVYRRVGFSEIRRFTQETNGGEWPFVEMRLSAGAR